MPKKKEPTGTTVAKESKQTIKKPATAATPAMKPPVVEAAKPAEKPAAPAKAEPAPAPTKAAEKPAAPAPTPAAPAAPAPAPAKAAEKPAAPAPAKAAEKPAAPAPAKAAEKPVPAPAKAAEKPVPAPAKAAEKPVPAPAKAAEKPVPAPAKAAEKPVPAPAKAEKAAAHPESNVTVIVAKYDVGHGNTMFIRGEGAGLTWEAGIQMDNAGNDVWVWTTNEASQGPVSFKFLINDEIWSVGDNMIAPVGETTTLYPSF